MPLCLLQLKSTATLPSQLIELPVSFLINFIYCVHPGAAVVISPVFWVFKKNLIRLMDCTFVTAIHFHQK